MQDVKRSEIEKRKKISPKIRKIVLDRDNNRCVKCGCNHFDGEEYRLQIDHIKPWSMFGSDDVSNLQTLCWSCNIAKSNNYDSLNFIKINNIVNIFNDPHMNIEVKNKYYYGSPSNSKNSFKKKRKHK